jgi:hypothetical protein
MTEDELNHISYFVNSNSESTPYVVRLVAQLIHEYRAMMHSDAELHKVAKIELDTHDGDPE